MRYPIVRGMTRTNSEPSPCSRLLGRAYHPRPLYVIPAAEALRTVRARSVERPLSRRLLGTGEQDDCGHRSLSPELAESSIVSRGSSNPAV
ncbi:hypothetical protein MTO96_011150 [Rhipicephalus appendiculatus]